MGLHGPELVVLGVGVFWALGVQSRSADGSKRAQSRAEAVPYRIRKHLTIVCFQADLLWFVWDSQIGSLCQTSWPEKLSFRVDETSFFFEI